MSIVRGACALAAVAALGACAPSAATPAPSGSAKPSPAASGAPSALPSPAASAAAGIAPVDFETLSGIKVTVDGAETAFPTLQKAKSTDVILINAIGEAGKGDNAVFSLVAKNKQPLGPGTDPADVTIQPSFIKAGGTTYHFEVGGTSSRELVIDATGIRGFMEFGTVILAKNNEKHRSRIAFNFAWSDF